MAVVPSTRVMTERTVNIGGWSTAVIAVATAVIQYIEAQAKAAESQGLVELVAVLVQTCGGG